MDLLLAFILAMVLTMALIPALMRRAGAMHVLDAPAERKVHARPMPRVGGIAMAVGVAVPLLLCKRAINRVAALLRIRPRGCSASR